MVGKEATILAFPDFGVFFSITLGGYRAM